MEFFTIGVYKSTENDFFGKLVGNNIDTFCDIRQRRGVRGAEYSFVNSHYLQQRLQDLNIRYGHILGLAPTSEIRYLQKQEDLQIGKQKRDRNKLGKVFILAYKEKILNHFSFDNFIEQLDNIGANRVVLFCVEEKAEACHRSIVADKLEKQGYRITHL
ncbi:MAG: DUF488 domain-containing protein [Prevotellaceae bacterium]|jgi:uncharacterized protein (DUF488 family)|nr:DUF488 domain-containing protein [Prevotellaceae bacterium]